MAAQRIKGLSLLTALKSAFARNSQRAGDSTIKTLIDAFDYPRLGPGQMWETVARTIAQHDAEVRLHADVAGDPLAPRPCDRNRDRHAWPTRRDRRNPFHEQHADSGTASTLRTGRAASRAQSSREPELQRFPHCGVGDRAVGPVSRQLDLRARSRCSTRADSKLQELEPGHGARSAEDLSRPRVFLLRGRRPLDVVGIRNSSRSGPGKSRHSAS